MAFFKTDEVSAVTRLEAQEAQCRAAVEQTIAVVNECSLANEEASTSETVKALAKAEKANAEAVTYLQRTRAALAAARTRVTAAEVKRKATEHAKLASNVEKLVKPYQDNGAALDAWLDEGAKLFAERRRLGDELIELLPEARYDGTLTVLARSDAYFIEQLSVRQIPGGGRAIHRDEASRKTCATVAREIGDAALAIVRKSSNKPAPGA